MRNKGLGLSDQRRPRAEIKAETDLFIGIGAIILMMVGFILLTAKLSPFKDQPMTCEEYLQGLISNPQIATLPGFRNPCDTISDVESKR